MRKSDLKWFLFAFLVKLAYTALVSYLILPEQSNGSSISPFGENLYTIFFYVVVLIPALETFFFQFGIIELITQSNKGTTRVLIALVSSGILFGLMHFSSLEVFLAQIISGLMYASFYWFAKQRLCINAFLFTFLIHASHNSVGFILNELL